MESPVAMIMSTSKIDKVHTEIPLDGDQQFGIDWKSRILTVKKVRGRKTMVAIVNCFMLSFCRAPEDNQHSICVNDLPTSELTIRIEDQINHIVSSSPHLIKAISN